MLRKVKRKNKRAISLMISYILLISMAVAMSLIVYAWVKTYVPKDVPGCPDGVSLLVTEASCIPGGGFKITLKNNGLFTIHGYFLKAITDPDGEIATEDLGRLVDSDLGYIQLGENGLGPSEISNPLDISSKELDNERVFSIEITPLRFQEDEKKVLRTVSCGGAKIRETLNNGIGCEMGP